MSVSIQNVFSNNTDRIVIHYEYILSSMCSVILIVILYWRSLLYCLTLYYREHALISRSNYAKFYKSIIYVVSEETTKQNKQENV